MSYPHPSAGQPPSFKTNVNRAKTKRWVEAKSYSYDGDDWGDMDEYDEYGGYDEPPPPPRPTGLRQRGQSANREQQPLYQPEQGNYQNPEANQHGYGHIGRQGPMQHQYGGRSVTSPREAQVARSGSFDHGDERRAFSATFPQQGMPPSQASLPQHDPYAQAPNPAIYSQTSGVPAPRSQPNQPGPPPTSSDYPRQPNMGSRTQSMTSNTSIDFHDRRDFSPSAVPHPLHTRGSPSPHNKNEAQSTWRPPRKSSLGQQNQPERMYEDHNDRMPVGADTQARESTSRERTASDSGKPLPFVRPADIYKRMQEEKERERQSQDSSRPSMDAILDDSKTGSDLRPNSSGPSERSQEPESQQRSRSTLDPVAERRSEYGMADLIQNEAGSRHNSGRQETATGETSKTVDPRRGNDSLSPQLPDVARMSGFGELFSGSVHPTKDTSPFSSAKPSDPSQTDSPRALQDQSDSSLQHQPSLGFRSVVHQAFDTTHEQIPATPSSNADSSIDRSGSRGTSIVSPIISRGSSSAAANLNSRDPHIRPATPPIEVEEPDGEDRPQSSSSLGTPKAVLRKTSPDPSTRRPASFMPGHRRDLSTPSPDNSPARTPALEANRQLKQPQEAELAMTTPIETHFPHNQGQSESARDIQSFLIRSQGPTGFPAPNADRPGPTENDTGETPKSPAESTRSRVRNLADKFESGRSSPAGSERAASPVKTSFLPSQTPNQSRPLPADRLESFRPRLPGGWESSASLVSFPVTSKPEPSASAIPLEQRLQNTATISGPEASTPKQASHIGETFRQEESSLSQSGVEAPKSDPFASLAAAGSALAGAFSTALGSDQAEADEHPSRKAKTEPSSVSKSLTTQVDTKTTRSPSTSTNTAFFPEASKPAMLTTPDDETSSIMPTPLDKVSQPAHSGPNTTSGYFPTSAIPKQQASGDSYTSQDSASTKRSQLLPTLNTEPRPQYESDRLRREIIRELSPRVNPESSTPGFDQELRNKSRQSVNLNLDPEQRESLIIPREYDSYWNDSGSERSSRASSTKEPPRAARDTVTQNAALTSMPQSRGEAPPVQDNILGRPTIPPHRFSWERPSEGSTPKQESAQPESPLNDKGSGYGAIDNSQMLPPINSNAPVEQQALYAPTSELYASDSRRLSNPLANENTRNSQKYSPSHEKEAVFHSNNIEPSSASEYTTNDYHKASAPTEPPLPTSKRESIPTGGPFVPQPAEEPHGITPQPTDNSINFQPLPVPATTQPKIQSFREILALKAPQDRIRAYNETRQQYANIESGLAHWLAVTTAELPDHQEVLPNGKFPGTATSRPSATRAKLGSLLPGSSSTQQPYYQQYLNASSPGGAGPDAVNTTGSSSPQGYSPSSSAGKLTSQQMQARGKDFLHSAGIFGGKANVAAKGLFSKGKSKLKGGNADKGPIITSNTNQQSGQQQERPSSERYSGIGRDEFFTETSIAPEHSVSSRPRSFAGPPSQQTHGTSRNITPNQSQPSPQPQAQLSTGDVHDPESTGYHGATGVTEQSLVRQEPSPRDAPLSALTAGSPTSVNSPRDLGPNDGRTGQEQHIGMQNRDVQSPRSFSSSNRTPTQADYADYFQGGPSPAAGIHPIKAPAVDQPNSDRVVSQEPAPESHNVEEESLLTSRAKHSIPSPTEVSSKDAYQRSIQPNLSQADQITLQRGSEDSDGTFQTAKSDQYTNMAKAAIEPHPTIAGRNRDEPTNELARESSGEISPVSPAPVAVPAANIQDQSRSRPFSFVQFSKSPTLQPLEDYSRREPSIDSTASRVDTDDGFPPSPMSSRQSAPHPQADELGRRSPIQHNADHDLTARSGFSSSSPGFQPIAQPFQGSNLQDHPAFQRQPASNKEDERHIPDMPAAVPRQDAINPRQQSTEYSLDGVGPPPEPRPRPSTSTSKRGSRSSAFFRSFKSTPTETTSPQFPSESVVHNDVGNQETSKIHKTKSKRGSLFRSLTGAAKNSSNESSVGETKKAAVPDTVEGNTHTSADMGERNEKPTKVPSKYRNRLSRAATAKLEEQQQQKEPSKKNRFSAIGSLFGRSKDQKGSDTGLDRSQRLERVEQQFSQQSRGFHDQQYSSNNAQRGSAFTSTNASRPSNPNQYTRNELAREGFLTEDPIRRSSKTTSPLVNDRNAAQERSYFPPRDQSLGQANHGNERRPSNWSRQTSSASYNTQTHHTAAPPQQHRVQSSVTTRSTTRHSGLRQPEANPRQFSSTTTTTTTTFQTPNANARQQSLGNNFPRSNSPPPPPPPPKDNWHTRTHQRSTSNNSFAQAVRGSNDYPSHTRNISNNNNNNYGTAAPQTKDSANYSNLAPPDQTRQSLPPLQTNVASPSLPYTKTHGSNSPFSDLEPQSSRRSRVESMGTPKAEQPGVAASAPVGRRNVVDADDEPIVMSATSFPGQEWQPSSFASWEGD